jgi:hypothetical protein
LRFFFRWGGCAGSGRGGFRGSWSSGAIAVTDHADYRVDLDSVALGNLDLLEDTAGGRGDFGVHLISGNFE